MDAFCSMEGMLSHTLTLLSLAVTTNTTSAHIGTSAASNGVSLLHATAATVGGIIFVDPDFKSMNPKLILLAQLLPIICKDSGSSYLSKTG